MTEKLFYKDPYICEADCEIVNIIEKDGKYELELKSTPFYPEGGGQPSDLGFINDIRVQYVFEREEIIYHVVGTKPENNFVKCKVDYDRRVDHIQQHSGEHLISAAFFKLYNVTNAGFHLGEEYVTVDIEIKDMTEDMIKKAEFEANSYIYRNEQITTYFLNKKEALKLPLRKEIKAEGNIRIVQMGTHMDFSACCGTHVNSTGEVGIIKITRYEKYKGMTRIYVKCGYRALKDYINKHDIITDLAKGFSSEASEVVNKVKLLKEEMADIKTKLSNLYSTIALTEALELEQKATSNIIKAEYEEEGFDFLEKLYDKLKDKKYILVLSSIKERRIIFAHNGEFDIDCGKLFKCELQQYNGRGGGNTKRAQANFEDVLSLNNFTEFLIENLR